MIPTTSSRQYSAEKVKVVDDQEDGEFATFDGKVFHTHRTEFEQNHETRGLCLIPK